MTPGKESTTAVSPWTIQMLGSLSATHPHLPPLRFRTQNAAALLAFLARSPLRPCGREVLIETFWPEADPVKGRHRLSMELSSLRTQLEPAGCPTGTVLLADRYTVGLNPAAVTTDVAAFEGALARAKALADPSARIRERATALGLYETV